MIIFQQAIRVVYEQARWQASAQLKSAGYSLADQVDAAQGLQQGLTGPNTSVLKGF